MTIKSEFQSCFNRIVSFGKYQLLDNCVFFLQCRRSLIIIYLSVNREENQRNVDD